MDNRDTEGKQGDFGGISGRDRGETGGFWGNKGNQLRQGQVCMLSLAFCMRSSRPDGFNPFLSCVHICRYSGFVLGDRPENIIFS